MSPPATASRPLRVRRGRWRILAGAGGAAVVGLLLAGVLAAAWRPGWYRPAAVDHELLRADKAALFALQDQISAALNAGRPARFELRAEQVNRWLAARAELWPEVGLDLGPLCDPLVRLGPGAVQAAATAGGGGLRAVLSLTWRVQVTPDAIVVEAAAARLGALPIPAGWAAGLWRDLPLEGVAGGPLAGTARVTALGRSAVRIDNAWVWPNGRRRCRLAELRFSADVVTVQIDPLPAGR